MSHRTIRCTVELCRQWWTATTIDGDHGSSPIAELFRIRLIAPETGAFDWKEPQVESHTFDALTKTFGAGTTRRSALKGVAGGVLGLVGLAGLRSGVAAGPRGTCPNGKDSSCPEGFKCDPNKTCFRCPKQSVPTLAGTCKCNAKARVCNRRYGGKTAPRIEYA
jgi:hypothetical protein